MKMLPREVVEASSLEIFKVSLGIYLAALLGNGLIITTIACDQHLHTPMYFFLLSLSLLVIPPAVNPLIYSMRSQDLKNGLKKLMSG
ncbi:olfactory receptor 4B13-like [Heliangelus exortis]|uniref:olfactory receptor 4B13-like n=1 Tax=Heliangelus exortis TaxID=472823 RepID=UPI003A9470D4